MYGVKHPYLKYIDKTRILIKHALSLRPQRELPVMAEEGWLSYWGWGQVFLLHLFRTVVSTVLSRGERLMVLFFM
jgi:hypothetical protein